jgi:hypothetical protein
MITEQGTLPIGIEYKGKVHKEFTIRPQFVRDSVDAVEDERAQKNDSYLGLIVLSKQIEKLGDIPKESITPDLLMDMYDCDLAEMHAALGRLTKRLLSFRKKGKRSEDSGSRDGKAGVSVRRGDDHARGGDGRLPGDICQAVGHQGKGT